MNKNFGGGLDSVFHTEAWVGDATTFFRLGFRWAAGQRFSYEDFGCGLDIFFQMWILVGDLIMFLISAFRLGIRNVFTLRI